MTEIPTLAEAMVKESHDIIQIMFFRDHANTFDKTLNDALSADLDSPDCLVRLITLAYAANTVAAAKETREGSEMHGTDADWYREMGQRLLVRSMDAISTIAVSEGYRPASGPH